MCLKGDKLVFFQLLRTFFSNKPSYVIFFVTSKCNSRCRMCFYWRNIDEYKKKKELSLDEIKKISKKFYNFTYLTISGGEPFMREDLPEIISTFVKNNNVKFVAIPTNGLLPDKIAEKFEEILRRFPNTSFRITLPVDGLREKHDKIRGVKGNFKKFLESYHKLDLLRKKYKNFNLDVNTVLSSYNQDEVIDIIKYVNKNLNVDNHVLALVRGNTREKIAKNISIKKYKEAMQLIEKIAAEKKDRRKGIYLKLLKTIKLVMRDIILKTIRTDKQVINCMAGRKLVAISETGDVYPCELLSAKLGNLRQRNYDIKRILKSWQAKKIKKHIKKTGCFCTFECAIQNSLMYNAKMYPAIIRKFLKLK